MENDTNSQVSLEADSNMNEGIVEKKWYNRYINLYSVISLLVLVIIAISLFVYSKAPVKDQKNIIGSDKSPLVILWADWAPANSLKELVKYFTKETGIPVEIQTKSWAEFQDYTFSVLSAKKKDFDLVVGDSQWLGRGSREGRYVDLTNFVNENKLTDSLLPIAVEAYGEYPKGSSKYWAVPLEGDALGWAYRKDLFEDPEEKIAFKKKYQYELGVPETWDEVRDIAEFFYRPEQNFYGIGLPTGIDHDVLTMGVENLIWAFGGDLGDYKTHMVKGILDSKESIAGLEFFKTLYKFTPPGYNDAFYTVAQDDFAKGRLAMFFSYFAFYPDLEDKTKNPQYDGTAYFKMPKGPKLQVASLGGQGLSVNSYSDKKDQAFLFLEWVIRGDVQDKWAELGGFSTNKAVLSSEKFLNATRFNRAFAESMSMLKDFWADPVYPDLLKASQKRWSDYITTDKYTASETMSDLARDWENIFEYAGYYKE